jgi:DnaJ-class molecular chaperone
MNQNKLVICPECEGKKRVKLWLGIRPKTIMVTCGYCNGKGRVTETERDKYVAELEKK